MSDTFDREISIPKIVGVGVGLALLIVVSALAMFALSAALRDRGEAADPPPPVLVEARRPAEIPGPLLQTDPQRDIDEMRAAERDQLEGWGWIDESRGLARVPVERAIDLYLEGARAAAPEPMAAPAGGDSATVADEAPEGTP